MAELISAEAPDAVRRAATVLEGGGTVALPTDTVYGIAALPGRDDAVARIFELKRRPAGVHLAVLVADATQVAQVSSDARAAPRHLMDTFWPGPLTLVLGEATPLVAGLGSGDGTIGVRCPDHDLVRRICAEVGPIAATSANIHGEPTPPTAAEVAVALGGLDLVLDGGVCAGGVASTVVNTLGDQPVILREGPISPSAIVAAWRHA